MEAFILRALVLLVSISRGVTAGSWSYLQPAAAADSKQKEYYKKSTRLMAATTPGVDSDKYKLLHYLAAPPSSPVPPQQALRGSQHTENTDEGAESDITHGATSRGGSSALNDVGAGDLAHLLHDWHRQGAEPAKKTDSSKQRQARVHDLAGSTIGCDTYFEDPTKIPSTNTLRWQAICQAGEKSFCHNGGTCTLEVTSFLRSVGFPYACQCQPGYTGYCCQHRDDSTGDVEVIENENARPTAGVRPSTAGIPTAVTSTAPSPPPQSSAPFNRAQLIQCNNFTGELHIKGETEQERHSRICHSGDEPLCYNGGRCSLEMTPARKAQGSPYSCRCPAGFGGPCCQYEACSICPCVYGETCVANTDQPPWRKCYRYSHENGYLAAVEILRVCPLAIP